jgi:2-haloacid dehalogenase
MPEPVRHIVFDIGKVLIHYDPDIPFTRLIPDPDRRRWFFENVCTPAWNIEQDRGRPWAEAEALLIGKFPEEEANIRAFRRHWHEMVPHAYEDTVAILERLIDRGHDVTMLTNFASDTLVEARERFAFLSRSRGVTVSGEVLLLKPQREIYEHHAREFALTPPNTLFIDDSAANVQGAIDAGWQAIRFVDAATLRRDLAERGIAVA